MKIISLASLVLLLALPFAKADVIADFGTDFASPTPHAGWAYQWNSGELKEVSKYKPLVWNESAGGYTASAKYPDDGPANQLRLGGPYCHPGSMGDKGGVCTIASYTLKTGQGGKIKITNSKVNRINETDAGSLAIYILVNRSIVKQLTTGSTTAFDNDLGVLNDGDVISIAVGPDQSDVFDAFKLEYQLERN